MHLANTESNKQGNSGKLIGGLTNEVYIDEKAFKKALYKEKQILSQNTGELTKRDTIDKDKEKGDTDLKSKRYKNDDPASSDYLGPWAVYEGEEEFDKVNKKPQKLEFELQERIFKDVPQAKYPGEMDPYYPPRPEHNVEDTNFKPTSTFHISETRDYKGRSFVDPPNNIIVKDVDEGKVPSKCIGTLKGHIKGVQVIKFFPKYGNMLLSCSFDTTIKLWDVMNQQKCLVTYKGHTSTVKDICFNNDGKNFLSAGFDNRIQYWDTETGKPIVTFNSQKHPYCVRLNPDPDRQHLFLTANLNSKIEQYDIRVNKKIVSYEDHLDCVNYLMFVDDNKKFVSCGDDKRMYMWEFGTPVVIKNISDPDLQTITTMTLRPDEKYFIAQSGDNKVTVFDVTENNLKWKKNKYFKGHRSIGYSINTTFSNNGKIVTSGSDDGRLYFWDWKTTQLIKTIPAHKKVCNWVEWAPNSESMVATCSWDHTIKLWA